MLKTTRGGYDGKGVWVVRSAADTAELDPELATHAQEVALRIARELDVVGMRAVELFETRDGRILVNELAMRPHNSGHWTIDGSLTSQFEQHLRAVLNLPLGATGAVAPVAVLVNILASYLAVGVDEP